MIFTKLLYCNFFFYNVYSVDFLVTNFIITAPISFISCQY
jgi:hypothetical protein